MPTIIEKYLETIFSLGDSAAAVSVLRSIASDFGFRSATLIKRHPGLKTFEVLIDTYPERRVAGEMALREFGAPRVAEAFNRSLELDTITVLGPDRFPPGHPYRAFSEQFDLLDVVAVRFRLADGSVGGMACYSGNPVLSACGTVALQSLSHSMFIRMNQWVASPAPAHSRVPRMLTPREREVMLLSAIGMTSTEIASKLGMSPRTVNQHVNNVADKLGTRNRTHTIAELMRNHMLG